MINRSAPPQYQNSAERERAITNKVRRRRGRPFVLILIVCALLLAASAIYNHLQLRRLEEQLNNPQTPVETPALPETTPEPQEPSIVITPAPVADTPAPTQEPKESTYEVIVSDVSWISARDNAINAGGHLVVINDEEEYRRVLHLIEEYPVSYVWLGCRRVDGAMTWVESAEVDYWPWLEGEPSFVDGEVAEDYLMLCNFSGVWGYNDNRNDPAKDYPVYYSGRIAYVIEFEH